MGDQSTNFDLHEFRCLGSVCCAGTSVVLPDLVYVLQAIRTYFGVAVHINRGFSCNVHNKAVGGVLRGWHTRGGAVDCKYLSGVSGTRLVAFCRALPQVGMLILYDTHWHMDVRPRVRGHMKLIDKRTK